MHIGFSDVLSAQLPCYAVEGTDVVVDILGLVWDICLVNVAYLVVGVVVEQDIPLKSRFRVVGGNSCGSYGVCCLDVSIAVVDTDYNYAGLSHLHKNDLLRIVFGIGTAFLHRCTRFP